MRAPVGNWEWGTVPSWLEAIATLVAAIAAIGAWRAARRALARDHESVEILRQEAADRQRMERTAHASRVTFAPTGEYLPNPEVGPTDYAYAGLKVHNRSDEPITQVFVQRLDAEGVTHGWSGRSILDGGQEWITPLRGTDIIQGTADLHEYFAIFTDRQGVRWRRFADGQLEQLVEQP